MIGLHEVSFSYPGSSALLKQLSFEFDRGFFYGIYGANGSGNSTLLKLITVELIPDSGRVNVPWQNEKQRSCQLAFMEQNVPEHLPLTVREVAALGRYPWDRSCHAERGKTTEILDRLGLLVCADVPYEHLSGGERQRVMLARALVQETPLLLLDEPASSMDIGFQHHFYKMLKQEASAGKCIIMVSHDLFTAPGYLDKILMLKAGELFQHGIGKEVITDENLREVYSLTD